jgi:hypothetical protein
MPTILSLAVRLDSAVNLPFVDAWLAAAWVAYEKEADEIR